MLYGGSGTVLLVCMSLYTVLYTVIFLNNVGVSEFVVGLFGLNQQSMVETSGCACNFGLCNRPKSVTATLLIMALPWVMLHLSRLVWEQANLLPMITCPLKIMLLIHVASYT